MTKPQLSPCLNLEVHNGIAACSLPKECSDLNCPNPYARRWHNRKPSLKCLYVWKNSGEGKYNE
jgi:hypothetical protein